VISTQPSMYSKVLAGSLVRGRNFKFTVHFLLPTGDDPGPVSLGSKVPTTLCDVFINHEATDVAVEKDRKLQLWDRFRANRSFKFSNLLKAYSPPSLGGHRTKNLSSINSSTHTIFGRNAQRFVKVRGFVGRVKHGEN
jgi:hypothetical protein